MRDLSLRGPSTKYAMVRGFSKHINDEERIFVMLLILVLARLFNLSLAKEELWGVK